MTHNNPSPQACAQTMKLIGDYWTLRIIDALKNGETRFCELQRQLDNLNPTTLTSRLKKLEDAGIVMRSVETVDKVSVTYRLSDLGQQAVKVITALYGFAAKAKSLSSYHTSQL